MSEQDNFHLRKAEARLKRISGLPFDNNSFEVAVQVVQIHAQRRRALGGFLFTPLNGGPVLRENETLDKTVEARTSVTITAETGAHRFAPPALPDFFLSLLAKSKRDKAQVGCINECFARNCEEWGRPRADRIYWAEALQFLLPLIGRLIGRALKLAVVVDFIKRHFIG